MKFEWANGDKMACRNKLLMCANTYEDEKQTGLKGVAFMEGGRAVWCGQKHYYTVICKKDSDGNRSIIIA